MLERTVVPRGSYGPLIEKLMLIDGDAFSMEIEVVVNPDSRDHYIRFRPRIGEDIIYEVELTDDELDVLARKIRTFRYATYPQG